jgi:hypothetical protein
VDSLLLKGFHAHSAWLIDGEWPAETLQLNMGVVVLLQIDAFTGEKYFQSVSWQDGKMVPAGWKRCAGRDTA